VRGVRNSISKWRAKMATLKRKPRGFWTEWVWRQLDERGELTATQAGQMYHAEMGYHDEDEVCAWCKRNGAEYLARLICEGKAKLVDEMTVEWKQGRRNLLLNRSPRRNGGNSK
jgi:hypothetical protein